jgi:hypothetical protein
MNKSAQRLRETDEAEVLMFKLEHSGLSQQCPNGFSLRNLGVPCASLRCLCFAKSFTAESQRDAEVAQRKTIRSLLFLCFGHWTLDLSKMSGHFRP